MPELKDFADIDFTAFEAKKAQIEACLENHIKDGEEKICANCKIAPRCERIKAFSLAQFEVNSQKLKQCQASNNRSSCFDCELFFDCSIRHDYVKATYEKMNEGRGGNFDF